MTTNFEGKKLWKMEIRNMGLLVVEKPVILVGWCFILLHSINKGMWLCKILTLVYWL